MANDPKQVTAAALQAARKSGAQEAEAFLVTNRELTVNIRDGRAESVKQADARGLGLRVLVDGKTALVYTSDFRTDALGTLAERAVALAKGSVADPANVFAEPAQASGTSFELYDPAVAALKPDQVIQLGVEAEKAARGVDPRIKSTQTGGATCSVGETRIANTRGVDVSYPRTTIAAFIAVLADDADGKKRTGIEGSQQRFLADLMKPEEIGKEAGRRAARMVGAKKVPTQKLPVLMHSDQAANWLQNMFGAFSGEQVFKKASYLTEKMGQSVASPLVTIVDDPLRKRAPGGVPYDDEGVPTQRLVLLDQGVVKSFAYNLRWASKAGAKSTGHAVRGYTSVPGLGPRGLTLENGATPVEEIIKGLDLAFYLTNTGAFGYDPATGGWSYQASGLMIEKGAITYPVTDVSLASDTLTMLKGVQKVGNDLEIDGPVNSPHLLIAEMALSGT
jgi:PmbA protein